ncbi:hypothetical protein F2P81_023407 [Scophthalmus maximus]|uniref:CCHC-type domain-containing protein n=1 Tax=Scophthalmus maximus TaxID=52904 RepID=A0A6A4RWQ4_SCOMX|nr:hypothetical protein F2P81_023407 [Scophthalmus maximus]
MRERLLREKNMTLDSCIQLCRAAELSHKNSKAISELKVEEVHAVQGAARQRQTSNTLECKFYGKTHERSKQKCPAYGKKCKKCGKDNHFAVKCRARPEQKKKRPLHNVAECESDEYEEILCVPEADTENVEDTQLFAGMLLGKDVVKFQIDCGASCNIIPIELLNPDTKLNVQQKQTEATGEMLSKAKEPKKQKTVPVGTDKSAV